VGGCGNDWRCYPAHNCAATSCDREHNEHSEHGDGDGDGDGAMLIQ
jgi:hypothetical protein